MAPDDDDGEPAEDDVLAAIESAVERSEIRAACLADHAARYEEAREAWGKRITIWGGIPSIILGPPFSERELEAYMEDLFRTISPGDAFILGVGDNVMPEAQIKRVARATQMVREWGKSPIARP